MASASARAARTPSTFLMDNPSVAAEIEGRIRAANGLDFHMAGGADSDDLVDM